MSRSFLMKMGVVAFMFSTSTAMAAMVSTMGNVNAVMEERGFRLVPVSEVYVSGDESPARVYEIIRPNNERITIGRLNTSCSCVQLEAEKSVFQRGERALVTLRNVRATPPNGQNYAFYVQVTSPIRTTLRADLFIQSDRFLQAQPQGPDVAMQPYSYQQQYQQQTYSYPEYPQQYQPQHQTQYQQPQYQYQQQPQQYSSPQPTRMGSFSSSSRQSYQYR